MACILDDGKLTLSGDVGDLWFDDYFTHGEVVFALAQIDDNAPLTVYLNSGGGIASEGAAIHALLSRRSGQTDIVVDGVAASAASLIAMAGNSVIMSTGSVMMIHDPANITVGNSADHAKMIEQLEAFATSYSRVYAAKSGKSEAECRAIMKAERWYSPDDAVADGFADKASQDSAGAVAAFDYRIYAHAPQRLAALASKKNWRLPDAGNRAAASAASSRREKETTMTDKERADQLAAEIVELKARMQSSKDADATAAMEKELAELRAEKTARANADAIMALDEAKGREDQARALADAGVDAAKAKAVLAAGAKASDDDDEDDPKRFEQQRMQARGHAQPGNKTGAKGDRSVLASAVERTNKRR